MKTWVRDDIERFTETARRYLGIGGIEDARDCADTLRMLWAHVPAARRAAEEIDRMVAEAEEARQ